MNYECELGYADAHQRSHLNANLRLLQQLSLSSTDTQVNNQYILEYNYFRAYATSLLHEINNTRSRNVSQRHRRMSLNCDASGQYQLRPLNYCASGQPQFESLDFTTRVINRLGVPASHLNDNQYANTDISGIPRITNTSLDEFMRLDYIISDILMRDYGVDVANNADIDTSVRCISGLSETEIVNGLIDISFNLAIHGGINAICPIALDDFEDNDSIKQILKCGHIYKPYPLMKWFERHTRCPLCRYDLRLNGHQF